VTTPEDWKFRAEHLRDAASRLYRQAEDMRTEANWMLEQARIAEKYAGALSAVAPVSPETCTHSYVRKAALDISMHCVRCGSALGEAH
jgi:hypothetical protein